VLHDWAGFEASEVAKILGTNESTVRYTSAAAAGSLILQILNSIRLEEA
jgi:DNA-directed RNA polymerase specialized sigma24 family protein